MTPARLGWFSTLLLWVAGCTAEPAAGFGARHPEARQGLNEIEARTTDRR